MKRIAYHRGLGSFMVTLLLAGLVGLASSTPAQAAKGVNLVITGTAASPREPLPGRPFTIRVTVQNNGGGEAGAFRVEAYRRQRSLDKRAKFQGLAPGARDTQSIALKYPGGISTLAAGPSAVPKRFCVDLVINKLKNKKATVGPSEQVCVSAKTVAKSRKQPEKLSERPSERTTPLKERLAPPVPTPVAPRIIRKPNIRVASLEINPTLRKFELEFENKGDGALRNSRVEVMHGGPGKKEARIYRDYLTLRPKSNKLLRIDMPDGVQSKDYLKVLIDRKPIPQMSLRRVLDEEMLADLKHPAVKELGLGKKGFKPFKLPSNRRPTVLYMTLRVNGEVGLPDPVSVAAGATAEVTWTLPAGSTADGINMRVNDGPFTTPCSTDETTFGDFSNPDSGYRSGGSHPLTLTDGRYRAGRPYYVMGCFWNRDTGYTGDWTNVVEIQYAFSVAATETSADIPVLDESLGTAFFTDLSIYEMVQVLSGRDRGKIAILVQAQPVGGGNPARDSFPVVLINGTETVWEGTGRVGRIFGGWGDWIVTDYVLPRSPVYLKARINLTPYSYDEAGNIFNNVVRKAFNWESGGGGSRRIRTLSPVEATEATRDREDWFGIRAVTRVREGPDWSRVNVHSNVTSGFRCRVRMWGGRDWDRDDRVRCTGGNTRYAEGHLFDEFLCQVAGSVFGVAPFRLQETAYLECRDRESGNLMPTGSKEWVPRASVYDPLGPGADEFPDYFIPFAYIRYRDGKPRALTVNVSTDEFVSRAGMYTPRVTVDLMTSPATKVASRVYQLPNVGNPRHVEYGTFTIDLREGDGWEWNVEEPGRRYSPSWVQITLGSVVERPRANTDPFQSNNTYRIDLLRVHPRP